MNDESEQSISECRYQIVIPFVLRGLLIHLANEALDDSMQELIALNMMIASLLQYHKEAPVYFERFLT